MKDIKNIIVSDITEAISVFSPKGRFVQMNNRPCYGLSFCLGGQITYFHNGKEYISDANHAIILPEGQDYTLHGDKTGVFPVINFKCADFLTDTFVVYPINNIDSFMRDFEQIKTLSLSCENRTKIISILYDMIYKLSSENICQTILPAIEFIEKNYMNPNLSNKMLASKCLISEVYLRNLFIKYLKTTPKQYISAIRLQNAKHLLSESLLKINIISEECGFSSTYSFCRFFKTKTGITPTEYAKHNKIIKI